MASIDVDNPKPYPNNVYSKSAGSIAVSATTTGDVDYVKASLIKNSVTESDVTLAEMPPLTPPWLGDLPIGELDQGEYTFKAEAYGIVNEQEEVVATESFAVEITA